MTNKPCKICGSTDRFPSGPCRPCAKLRALTAEARREYQRKWYAENKEKHKARRERWFQNNPDKKREINRLKDIKKRKMVGKLSNGIHSMLWEKQGGLCVCCNRPLGENYHLDHIMPLALGGANTDNNVQLLRAECNMKKGAMHPDEWKKILAQK